MWTENAVFAEDLKTICENASIPWEQLSNKDVLITGATGLIGYTVASALLYHAKMYGSGIRVHALVRNLQKAQTMFAGQLADGCDVRWIEGTVEQLPAVSGPIDYIIHGACPTSSYFFKTNPVETIHSVLLGTSNILNLAREKQASGVVFLSSMEVYGQVNEPRSLSESDLGYIDLASPRSSYPESKRLAENLCAAFWAEYRVPVRIVRLAQTFGPGVQLSDERVFAYMARCALQKEDICLKTSGSKENLYLYTADAASALLTVLLTGESGQAYNAGNEATYCSVREMAQMVAATIGGGEISVHVNTGGATGLFFPDGYLKLNTAKLASLNWRPAVSLEDMFRRMVACF